MGNYLNYSRTGNRNVQLVLQNKLKNDVALFTTHVEVCPATNQVDACSVNTDFWLDKTTREVTPYAGSASLAAKQVCPGQVIRATCTGFDAEILPTLATRNKLFVARQWRLDSWVQRSCKISCTFLLLVLPFLKTLFTWSGGPRSSGVGFFCFVSSRAWKQKKPTPLDRGPPLHVNRPLGYVYTIERLYMTSRGPYWCCKTMKRRPCWCTKKLLWDLNCSLM